MISPELFQSARGIQQHTLGRNNPGDGMPRARSTYIQLLLHGFVYFWWHSHGFKAPKVYVTRGESALLVPSSMKALISKTNIRSIGSAKKFECKLRRAASLLVYPPEINT